MEETRDEKPIRVSRYQGLCRFCDFEGLVIEGYDPEVTPDLACPDCVLGGRASRLSPDHPAMRPVVFVARAMKGEEPFKTLLDSAEKQRENPEAHAAAQARIQNAIAREKALGEFQSRLGIRRGRRAFEAAERRERKRSKRAKLRPGR